MRHGLEVGALALLLVVGAGLPAQASGVDPFTRRLNAPAAPFATTLSPYGDWLDVQPFGTVWRPFEHVVGRDFIPYASRGRWAYAPVGWVFLSDWSWGWATFHYGYWFFDPSLGWLWIPGTEWAPAWVTWRFGAGIVGWAPIPPPFYGGWGPGWRTYWCFTSAHDFTAPWVAWYLHPYYRYRDYIQVTEQLPRHPVGGGKAWPVGPAPTEIAGRDDARVPTVSLRPPRAGHIARVEAGPVVDQPPAALGTEGWPRRAGREGPVTKPRERVEPAGVEPADTAQVRPERTAPPTAATLPPMPEAPRDSSRVEPPSRVERHRRAADLEESPDEAVREVDEEQGTGGAERVTKPTLVREEPAATPTQRSPPVDTSAERPERSAPARSPAERHVRTDPDPSSDSGSAPRTAPVSTPSSWSSTPSTSSSSTPSTSSSSTPSSSSSSTTPSSSSSTPSTSVSAPAPTVASPPPAPAPAVSPPIREPSHSTAASRAHVEPSGGKSGKK